MEYILILVVFCVLSLVVKWCVETHKQASDKAQEVETLQRRCSALEERVQQTTSGSAMVRLGVDNLQAFCQAKNIELQEHSRNEQWVRYQFTYQSGHFNSYASLVNDEVLLSFPSFYSVPMSKENLSRVQTLCNHASMKFMYGKCVYSHDEVRNELDLSLQMECIGPSPEALEYLVNMTFHVTREIINMYGQLRDERDNYLNQAHTAQLRIAEMAAEDECLEHLHPDGKQPNDGTLAEYIGYLFGEEKAEDMLSLSIMSQNGTTQFTTWDEISNYPVLRAIIDGEGEAAAFSGTSAVLALETVTNFYTLSLHPLQSTNEMLYVRMTATSTPHEYLQDYVPEKNYRPEAESMTLCFTKKKGEEPTGDVVTKNTTEQLRHGMELAHNKLYLQAIVVLTPIYRKLKRIYHLTEDHAQMECVCYYLGFCYNSLQQYEKAFFYLDLARKHTAPDSDENREFVNCLVDSLDVRFPDVYQQAVQQVSDIVTMLDQHDDRGSEAIMEQRERMVELYAFLQRRLGVYQMHTGAIDEAEKVFRNLLDHEGSKPYAEYKLQQIEELKRKQSEKETPNLFGEAKNTTNQ